VKWCPLSRCVCLLILIYLYMMSTLSPHKNSISAWALSHGLLWDVVFWLVHCNRARIPYEARPIFLCLDMMVSAERMQSSIGGYL
jgi:hypothetical protein